jgi:ribulose-phosphate 3-epimerase
VLPSLLQCDFGNLQREVQRLEEAGVIGLHLDVMDGTFVPNLSYGMPIVAALRRLTKLTLDVHLMIVQPQRYLRAFQEAGADILTVHVEACEQPGSVLEQIRELGLGAGLAFNPATPLDAVEPYVSKCDLVLAMSVPAGFGGQPFDPKTPERIAALRQLVPADTLLEVDGGLNAATIPQCATAGAQLFVVGSAIFRQPDYGKAVREFSRAAKTFDKALR